MEGLASREARVDRGRRVPHRRARLASAGLRNTQSRVFRAGVDRAAVRPRKASPRGHWQRAAGAYGTCLRRAANLDLDRTSKSADADAAQKARIRVERRDRKSSEECGIDLLQGHQVTMK